MFRKHLALILAALLTVSLVGCGLKNVLPSKKVPPLEGYTTVVLAPFDAKKPLGEYSNLLTMLSYGIGTKLSVRYEDRTWLYDQSERISPISEKIKELNISPSDIYENPETAIKLAEPLQADLVIATQLLEKPRFSKKESGRIVEDKSEVTPAGTSRFYSIFQTALLKADVKLIDVKNAQVIWDGRVIGYRDYETLYRTGSPQKFQREETMLADVRRDFVQKFVDKIYPVKVAEGK